MNRKGPLATIDHLEESITSRGKASEATQEYLRALDGIEEGGIDSNVSRKLTQMGLDQYPETPIS